MSVQDVQRQIDEAKEGKQPPIEDLWNNIYVDPLVSPPISRCHALTSRVFTLPAISSALSSSARGTCAEKNGLLCSQHHHAETYLGGPAGYVNNALGDRAAHISLPKDVLMTAFCGGLQSQGIMLCSSDTAADTHVGCAGSKDEAHGDWASQDSAAKGLRVSALSQVEG